MTKREREEREAERGQDIKKVTCRDCGKAFRAEQRKQFKDRRDDDTVLCRDEPGCRQRALRVYLTQQLGYKDDTLLFMPTPRRLLERLMDVRPEPGRDLTKNPYIVRPHFDTEPKKWQAGYTEETRVLAAIEISSWCYPVGLPYAAQIDVDGEPLWDRKAGDWARASVVTIAAMLGMHRQNVTRALMNLRMRRLVEIDPETERISPNPEPYLSIEDRLGISAEDKLNQGYGPSFIPVGLRRKLDGLYSRLSDDLSTESKGIVNTFCTEHRNRLNSIRSDLTEQIKGEVQRLASLLSRVGDNSERTYSAASVEAPVASYARFQDDGGEGGHKQHPAPANDSKSPTNPIADKGKRKAAAHYLYEWIPRLQGEYPKSAFSRQRFTMAKADLSTVNRILDELAPTGYDAPAFEMYVRNIFTGWDPSRGKSVRPKSPNDPGGPDSLGLFINYAKNFAEHYHAATAPPPPAFGSSSRPSTPEETEARTFAIAMQTIEHGIEPLDESVRDVQIECLRHVAQSHADPEIRQRAFKALAAAEGES